MARALTPIYWDACVFLSYIEEREGRVEVIESLLAEADEGKTFQIFTSVLSIAEVSYAQLERTGGALDARLQERIDALWVPPRMIVVELSEYLTREARTAVQQSMLRHAANQVDHPTLKGADACHLATAAYVGSKQFFTYDDKILKQNGYFPFSIETPVALQGRLF